MLRSTASRATSDLDFVLAVTPLPKRPVGRLSIGSAIRRETAGPAQRGGGTPPSSVNGFMLSSSCGFWFRRHRRPKRNGRRVAPRPFRLRSQDFEGSPRRSAVPLAITQCSRARRSETVEPAPCFSVCGSSISINGRVPAASIPVLPTQRQRGGVTL